MVLIGGPPGNRILPVFLARDDCTPVRSPNTAAPRCWWRCLVAPTQCFRTSHRSSVVMWWVQRESNSHRSLKRRILDLRATQLVEDLGIEPSTGKPTSALQAGTSPSMCLFQNGCSREIRTHPFSLVRTDARPAGRAKLFSRYCPRRTCDD